MSFVSNSRFSVLFIAMAVFLGGCSDQSETTGERLRLAVTTSTRDSGLLDQLVPMFEEEQDVQVQVVAVGTGKALKLGEAGDVDVVWVHDRAAENAFMAAGHGVRHEEVMFNSFVILGPQNDPAGIANKDPASALKMIAESQQRFVSRGDQSGTHRREQALWEEGGVSPSWPQYSESGQGMGQTLIIANERQAYVLTDQGTYLNFKKKLSLVPLITTSPGLNNPYGVMLVDPKKHPSIRHDLAAAFADYLISPRAQRIIRDYRLEGEPLFYPLRLPENAATGE